MSESSRLIQVAQILKSNGTDGEVLMGFRNIDPDDINLQEPVFICFDGLPVPFFIEKLTPRGVSKALCRLTGIHSLADAEELAGAAVYADASNLDREEEEEGLDLDALVGWTVRRADSQQVVGKVSGYEDIPGNPCLYIEPGSVLVPLHEDLVVDVDEDSRTLTLIIPEGLL